MNIFQDLEQTFIVLNEVEAAKAAQMEYGDNSRILQEALEPYRGGFRPCRFGK